MESSNIMESFASYVSVIVPVYNVETYLVPCIESILCQIYPHFELLLVDDGSTDGSGAICDAVANTDSRIKVIHKPNGGLSDARNHGMRCARGKYITFIDSDDTVTKDFLSILVTKAEEQNADIVQCNFALREEDLHTGTQSELLCDGSEGLRRFLIRDTVYVAACGKLYKRGLFQDVAFPLGRINEDHCTVYKTIYKANKIICIDYALYWHRMRAGSIMHTPFSGKNLELANVADEIRQFLGNEQDTFRQEIDYYEYKIAMILLNALLSSESCKSYPTEKKRLIHTLLSLDGKNPYLSLKDRCINVFLKISPYMYGQSIRHYRKVTSHGA